jgi:DNA-binding transcriptional ArsR family regulator
MGGNVEVDSPAAEIFKALSDPIRWSILAQIADAGELACASLESTLPVSKPTISYHTKILQQADLISVRKTGRNSYYSLRDDVIHDLLDALRELAPTPASVIGSARSAVPAGRRPRRSQRAGFSPYQQRAERDDSAADAAILTW